MFHVIINSVPADKGLDWLLDQDLEVATIGAAEEYLAYYAEEYSAYGYIYDDSKSFWENQK